jgi:hypothetical protein
VRMLYLPVEDLDALERDPDVAGLWFADGDPLDLGPAWHAIHWLLNGSAWGGTPPLYDAVLGGTPIGDPTTYEPIRFVSPQEVAATAAELPAPEQLTPRFTHQGVKHAEVYPESWWDRSDVLTTDILPAYTQLKNLFQEATAQQRAMLITLDRS